MRTIKRNSLPINEKKFDRLDAIAQAYSKEKDYWLLRFSSINELASLKSYYEVRDQLVKTEYRSKYGLQARQWKLALKDALETIDKYWQALFQQITPLIHKNSNLSDAQKHYSFWILKDYSRVKSLILHDYPKPKFDITIDKIKQAGNYLNRIIRQHRGRNPRVNISRSFVLDQEMYATFSNGSTQYIEIMTLEKGKRLTIPLNGEGKISGQIRIILNRNNQTVEVHFAETVKAKWIAEPDKKEAIDIGITEVFTDSEGNTYGNGFGEILSRYSNDLNSKGKARNKLHALAKRAEESGQREKADNIRKFNLGFKKKARYRQKAQATIEKQVNQSFNRFFREIKPSILITENLRHSLSFDNSKSFNRKVSIWTKGIIQDRAEFKALEGSSLHKQVNPAYGSQLCPCCGFVWKKNRNGDAFKCSFCSYGAASDRVAAINYLTRSEDPNISLHMPYKRVRELLVERFLRRLECWDFCFSPSQVNWEAVSDLSKDWEAWREKALRAWQERTAKRKSTRTVPGRTPDTGRPYLPDDMEGKSRLMEGHKVVNTIPVNRRAKLPAIPAGKSVL
jgi:putative transposase